MRLGGHGQAGLGEAGLGRARRGGRGLARRGWARQGEAGRSWMAITKEVTMFDGWSIGDWFWGLWSMAWDDLDSCQTDWRCHSGGAS